MADVKDGATGGRWTAKDGFWKDSQRLLKKPAPLPVAEFECWTCKATAESFGWPLQEHDWKRGPKSAEYCRSRNHDVRQPDDAPSGQKGSR